MKKLFILTILFSANLIALTPSGAHETLAQAQKERNAKLAAAKEGEMRIMHLHRMAQETPTPESVAALKQAMEQHSQTVDHCKACVHGLQGTLKDLNAKGHYIEGDAFTGRVARAA